TPHPARWRVDRRRQRQPQARHRHAGLQRYRRQGQGAGYYLNVGGSWSQTSGGKSETHGNLSGWEYEKDREQIVRATVGAGEVNVRQDAETGKDSVAGLNRDLDKAYEITRDSESRTDLYVSDTSVRDVLHPKETLAKWQVDLSSYGVSSLTTATQLFDMVVSMAALATGESPRAIADRIASNEDDRQNALAFAKNLTRMNSFDSTTREAGIAALMENVTKGRDSPAAEQVRLLVNRLSADSPEAAQVVMLKLLGLSRGNPLRQNFNVGAVAATEVLVALAAASSAYLAASNSQEGWEKANTSFMTAMGELREKSTEDFEQAVEIWLWLHGKGNRGFPINPYDTKSIYENPIVRGGKHPASDGYNGADQRDIITHTGGQQLDGVAVDGGYVTPIDQLNPGLMLSIFGDEEIARTTIPTTSNQTRLDDKGGEPGSVLRAKIAKEGEFASEGKMVSHFEKHGREFGAVDVGVYMGVGREIILTGQKVEYFYRAAGECRTAYVKFIGNNSKGAENLGLLEQTPKGK
ncbi:hypothetical protein M9Y59_26935, partial [Pseudomonas mosselii]|nr:hypothetical protein [Pseudomonas mosselii]